MKANRDDSALMASSGVATRYYHTRASKNPRDQEPTPGWVYTLGDASSLPSVTSQGSSFQNHAF